MWQDGENKLHTIISYLRSARASMKEDERRNEAAAGAQPQTDGAGERTRRSDNVPDRGGSNTVEPGKEEAASAAGPAWQKAAQKQKGRKKSKKCKGRGRK